MSSLMVNGTVVLGKKSKCEKLTDEKQADRQTNDCSTGNRDRSLESPVTVITKKMINLKFT